MTGRELFACYAFPPNELGYCGPADTTQAELASHAKEFDGAWPYLQAIADAAGIADPLDDDVVRNYWVGGPLLDKVDPDELLTRLRSAFTGQVTGMLDDIIARQCPGPSQLSCLRRLPVGAIPRPRTGDAGARDAGLPDPMGHRRVRRRRACRHHVAAADVRRRHTRARRRRARSGCGGARTARRWRPHRNRAIIVAAHWDWVCATITDIRARRAGRCDRSGVGPGQRRESRFGWSIPGSPCSHEQPTGSVRRR